MTHKPELTRTDDGQYCVSDGVSHGYSRNISLAYDAYEAAKAETVATRSARRDLESFYRTLPQGAGNDEVELGLIAKRLEEIAGQDKPGVDHLSDAITHLEYAKKAAAQFDNGE